MNPQHDSESIWRALHNAIRLGKPAEVKGENRGSGGTPGRVDTPNQAGNTPTGGKLAEPSALLNGKALVLGPAGMANMAAQGVSISKDPTWVDRAGYGEPVPWPEYCTPDELDALRQRTTVTVWARYITGIPCIRTWRIGRELWRLDGPAVVFYDAAGRVRREEWWWSGNICRIDGLLPAVVFHSPTGQCTSAWWYFHGQQVEGKWRHNEHSGQRLATQWPPVALPATRAEAITALGIDLTSRATSGEDPQTDFWGEPK